MSNLEPIKENLPATQPEKVKVKISPYMRNFFFMAFKARKEYKDVQKELGKIEDISIIITQKKAFLRAMSQDKHEDSDITPEELKKFLKMINVKEEAVKDCKHIFINLDMQNKIIFIQQTKLDGTKKEIEI